MKPGPVPVFGILVVVLLAVALMSLVPVAAVRGVTVGARRPRVHVGRVRVPVKVKIIS